MTAINIKKWRPLVLASAARMDAETGQKQGHLLNCRLSHSVWKSFIEVKALLIWVAYPVVGWFFAPNSFEFLQRIERFKKHPLWPLKTTSPKAAGRPCAGWRGGNEKGKEECKEEAFFTPFLCSPLWAEKNHAEGKRGGCAICWNLVGTICKSWFRGNFGLILTF